MNLPRNLKQIQAWILRIGIILVVWVIFVLFVNYVVMPIYIRNWSETTVPDLRGLAQEEADKLADKERVKIVVSDVQFLAGVDAGVVLDQFPAPGGIVKPGRRVHVIVAAGAPMTEMPVVVGLSSEEAIQTIEASGLRVDTLYYAFSDSLFENQVLAQYPDSGAVLERESAVRLTLCLGKEPQRFLVPDVMNLPLDQAKYLILKAGLTVGTVEFDRYIGQRKGAVMNQNPPPKREMKRGNRVHLEVNYPEGWNEHGDVTAQQDSLSTSLTGQTDE